MAFWASGFWDPGFWDPGFWEGMAGGNASPTGIALSRTWCLESDGLNAVLGALSVSDPDSGDTHTLTLAAGVGDTDNASFNIDGNNLRCNDPATLTAGTYSVFIEADDGVSTPYGRAFTVYVYAELPASNDDSFARQVIRKGVRGVKQRFFRR